MTVYRLIAYVRRRFAAHRRYRKVVAEIRGLSNGQLHEIGAFEIDMLEAAKREFAQA